MYCSLALAHLETRHNLNSEIEQFLTADATFRSILKSIDGNTLARALLGHTKGHATSRFLQGHALKVALGTVVSHLGPVLSRLESLHLDAIRVDYPRFYFLTNDDLIEAISSGSLDAGSPAQRVLTRCFTNILQLISVKEGVENGTVQVKIIGLQGTCGRSLVFEEPVRIVGERILWEIWIREVELAMKLTMKVRFLKASKSFVACKALRLTEADFLQLLGQFDMQVLNASIMCHIDVNISRSLSSIVDAVSELTLTKV
jgi:hypothetical protein